MGGFCLNVKELVMALDDLHPYDFIQLYGYHPNHVKQEEQSNTKRLGDTIGISF
jgi:hypothetical protein